MPSFCNRALVSLHQIGQALATTLVLASCITYPVQVQAQPDQLVSSSFYRIPTLFSEQEPDGSSRGRPGGRVGTGSRGQCPVVNMPLSALVPLNNLGLAVEESPTFWFYVPYKPDQVSYGEFSLQDEQQEDVYRTGFKLPGRPGFVSLSLPSATPLKINKTYRWFFKLFCGDPKYSTPVYTQGKIQRVALKPKFENLLKEAVTPRERIVLYAQNGIWYKALADLAKLRLTEPQNAALVQDWVALLKEVGLEELAQEPIIGSVKAELLLEDKEFRNTELFN